MVGLRMTPEAELETMRLDGMGRLVQARYAPEVIPYMDGLGHHEPPLMGGILSSLFGKPQSWYDRINALQKSLALLQAQVGAVDKGIWNTIAGKLVEMGGAQRVGLKYFADYDWVAGEITARMQAILVTESHAPSDADIALADQRIQEFQPMVDYVKKIAPELVAQIEADRAKVASQIAGSRLVSPAEAGEREFYKSLEEQAGKLGQFGLGTGLIVAGIAAMVLLGGRRSNPRKKSGDLPLPLLAGGAAAVYLLSQKSSAPTAAPAPTRAAIPGATVVAAMPALVPTGIASYADAARRLDDLKTLWRSGRIATAADLNAQLNKLWDAANAVYQAGRMTTGDFMSITQDIGSFRSEVT